MERAASRFVGVMSCEYSCGAHDVMTQSITKLNADIWVFQTNTCRYTHSYNFQQVCHLAVERPTALAGSKYSTRQSRHKHITRSLGKAHLTSIGYRNIAGDRLTISSTFCMSRHCVRWTAYSKVFPHLQVSPDLLDRMTCCESFWVWPNCTFLR